jgi:hypothetical protein
VLGITSNGVCSSREPPTENLISNYIQTNFKIVGLEFSSEIGGIMLRKGARAIFSCSLATMLFFGLVVTNLQEKPSSGIAGIAIADGPQPPPPGPNNLRPNLLAV